VFAGYDRHRWNLAVHFRHRADAGHIARARATFGGCPGERLAGDTRSGLRSRVLVRTASQSRLTSSQSPGVLALSKTAPARGANLFTRSLCGSNDGQGILGFSVPVHT
jgi:hypothetical protein